jgi:hypothetical protein
MGLDRRAVETPLSSTPDWIGSAAARFVENAPDRQVPHAVERDDEVASRELVTHSAL